MTRRCDGDPNIVAAHADVRTRYPVIDEALPASASVHVRNMGMMGSSLLRRTRRGCCRDIGFACNKRIPGSGCAATRHVSGPCFARAR